MVEMWFLRYPDSSVRRGACAAVVDELRGTDDTPLGTRLCAHAPGTTGARGRRRIPRGCQLWLGPARSLFPQDCIRRQVGWRRELGSAARTER